MKKAATPLLAPFAERLLDAIQLNELALRAKLSDVPSSLPRQVRVALNGLLDFENRYGSRAYPSLEKFQDKDYVRQCPLAAQAAVLLLTTCPEELTGEFWDELLEMPGMNQAEFETAAYCFGHRNMTQNITLANGEVDVLVKFASNFAVYLEFSRGPARYYVSKLVTPANAGGNSIRRQLAKLQAFNAELQAFIHTAAHDESHWPSVKTVTEMEIEQVNVILDKLLAPLSPDEKQFLKKYRSELSKRVNNW